ncbi:DNA mismatch repair protein MutS [Lachnospiraceae bacterium OttesenSCG-928-D06]|nr:DNA mismatch repair protein MutS [Lachnospiraceae bacterium OttesenSCG-928-D06]
MQTSYNKLEFDKIKLKLQEKANTLQGKKMVAELEPYMNENELRRNLRDTTQAREMLDLIGTPPIPLMERVEEHLNKAVKGDMLLTEELEELGSFLTAVKRMHDYLERGKAHEISLAYYNENLVALNELSKEIERSIRNGKVDDYASGELKDIRNRIKHLETKIQEKAEQMLRTQKNYLADNFVVKRGGHICIPVKKEYKSRVPGNVIDKSKTGSTLFIEPQGVVALSQELELFLIEEDCEVRKILYTLSCMVAEEEVVLREDLKIIIKLDFVFAKGKLSLDMQACSPSINTNNEIVLKAARHPMLDPKDCVPLDIVLGKKDSEGKEASLGVAKRGLVITGPNTGGKTVAMKTVGLFSLMACSGLHLPCQFADISMQNQVLCDIGDGQNISDNLSTFSAHICNVVEILKAVTKESLVIMDELGSGTDPTEGMGIAISILEELRKSGCLFLATTHYPEVKTYAGRHEEIQSASMAFDRVNLKPLYKLELGRSGESCALYIAKRLGLPDAMLAVAAKEAYGDSNKEMFEEMLKEIGVEKNSGSTLEKVWVKNIQKTPKKVIPKDNVSSLKRGDSVLVTPTEQIGIVVKPADDQGEVWVQIKKEKVKVNHKRLKLLVKAQELYPEDYDFSIIFDSVENRKNRHKMGKAHQENLIIEINE